MIQCLIQNFEKVDRRNIIYIKFSFASFEVDTDTDADISICDNILNKKQVSRCLRLDQADPWTLFDLWIPCIPLQILVKHMQYKK